VSMEIKIPRKEPTKVGSSRLQSIARLQVNGLEQFSPDAGSAWYSVKLENFEHDFIFSKSQREGDLYVLLSGYADRERLQPPVFQRWSWASYFPGHCLYISDPTLKLSSEVGLAWYAGTKTLDVLPEIAEIIKAVSGKLGLAERNITFYASSGGAFAALKLLRFLPDSTVVAINPQTEITRYNSRHVDIYLDQFFDKMTREEALANYAAKLSLIEDAEFIATRNVVYAQNLRDGHHVKNHFQPFCRRAGIATDEEVQEGNFRTVLFDHAGGHAKGEPPELLPLLLENAWGARQTGDR
jgi:hypothetical protein